MRRADVLVIVFLVLAGAILVAAGTIGAMLLFQPAEQPPPKVVVIPPPPLDPSPLTPQQRIDQTFDALRQHPYRPEAEAK